MTAPTTPPQAPTPPEPPPALATRLCALNRFGLLAGIALVLLTFLAFWPAIRGTYIWDDELWLTQNQAIRLPDGPRYFWRPGGTVNTTGAPVNYYPMVFTSYWIEYQFAAWAWGKDQALDPLLYHLDNIVLQAAAALVLWRVLRRLDLRAAWLGAALWAIHPVQVESVAWVSERKNVLSGLFMMLTALAYLRFERLGQDSPADQPDRSAIPGRSWGWYAAMIVCFAAALLSKTVTVTLPAVLLLLILWKRPIAARLGSAAWWSALWPRLWPLAPMLIAGLLLARYIVREEATDIGASGAAFAYTPLDRVLLAGRVVWFYVGKLLWPHPLLTLYPRWPINPAAPWQYLFPLGVLAVLAILWLNRRRLGAGPLVAALAFVVLLAPALGFINFYTMRMSFVADHYQYHACVALLALAAELLVLWTGWLVRRNAPGAEPRLILRSTLASLIVLVPLVVLSTQESFRYRSSLALWSHTLARNPNPFVYNALGSAYITEAHDLSAAMDMFQRGMAVGPDDGRNERALANVHLALGDLAAAEPFFHRAKAGQAVANSPEWIAYAKALANHGRFAEAIDAYHEAIRRVGQNPEPYFGLALIYQRQNRPADAEAAYRAAAERGHVGAYYNLGNLLLDQRRYEEAVAAFQGALRLQPEYPNALYNLAYALHMLGRDTEANQAKQRAEQLERELKARISPPGTQPGLPHPG